MTILTITPKLHASILIHAEKLHDQQTRSVGDICIIENFGAIYFSAYIDLFY